MTASEAVPTRPVPPSVPPSTTRSPVPTPEPVVLLTSRVPAFTSVVPVYVLAPLRVKVSAPALVTPAEPSSLAVALPL